MFLNQLIVLSTWLLMSKEAHETAHYTISYIVCLSNMNIYKMLFSEAAYLYISEFGPGIVCGLYLLCILCKLQLQ